MTAVHPVLEPIRIGSLDLANRAAVAPMSRVSTAGDGVPTEAMARYYAAFAAGGFGLVVGEGTYFDHAHSQAYPDQPALVTDAQVAGWRAVVEAVHAQGGRIVAQLMHAGALVQGNAHRSEAIAPSAVAPKGRMLRGYGGPGGPYATPRAATAGDLEEVLAGVAAGAARAREAGFDGVEIHAANGYLFDQFLTKYTNLRDDAYGGAPERRARLTVEAIAAARAATDGELLVGVRVSQVKVNDLAYRWDGVEEGRAIFGALAQALPSYVHVASEGAPWVQTSFLAPDVSITGLARECCAVPVIANGGMHDPDLAGSVLDDGHADLVALGHGALANPDWPRRLAEARPQEAFDGAMLSPEVTIENAERWHAERVGDLVG
ncbi:NADH oxidase [Baekduia alba]|uniref:NADH:flavin oxidoreductase n=1 Tax=Baekduia alba TaxID=2997333 RepID=UPI0023426B7A|nr:NADH:flavin oxidoreductase [Baekduia alba]WCB96720.1 NADH oxidase [Baekduia alba]